MKEIRIDPQINSHITDHIADEIQPFIEKEMEYFYRLGYSDAEARIKSKLYPLVVSGPLSDSALRKFALNILEELK